MRGERVSVLYRVSTDQQGESGLGIAAQMVAVADRCRQEGWTMVHTSRELGVSGKTPLSQRQQLTEAMAIIAAGQAEILLVAKLDRLSRDPMEMLIIERTVQKTGGRIVSCAGEGTASDEPSQVLMRRVMSAVAENEAAMISQRTRVALAAKKARGERLGRPPFGFEVHNGELVPGRLFPELAACCGLLGWRSQTKEEILAWTGLPGSQDFWHERGRQGMGSARGTNQYEVKPKIWMSQQDIAEHLTEYHGTRTTWSHDKVGRISRRYDCEQRQQIVETWENMKKENEDG